MNEPVIRDGGRAIRVSVVAVDAIAVHVEVRRGVQRWGCAYSAVAPRCLDEHATASTAR